VSERNVLLFGWKLDYGHYYSLLQVEEKDRLGASDGLFLKHFLLKFKWALC
jgi:hypothetical protein